VKDHIADVAEFARESQSSKDPALKNFARQTLPTLRQHLKEAEKLAPEQKTTASNSSMKRSSAQ
jgi:putative membrane protein